MSKHNNTNKLFRMLANGEVRKVTLTALNHFEAKTYSETLNQEIKPGTKLIVTNNAYRHLVKSAHITGNGAKQRVDPNPLSERDFAEITLVFKKPDKLKCEGGRIIAEKKLSNYHRLVIELEKYGKSFRLITYFNINKKPLRKEKSLSG